MGFPVHRPRRLRAKEGLRRTLAETTLAPHHLIYPLFVDETASAPRPIEAMPGQFRWPVSEVLRPIEQGLAGGVSLFLLFGVPSTKDALGSAAWQEDGVVPKAVAKIKALAPEAVVMTDVCLCAYTDHGHCGVLDPSGMVANDASLPLLARTALAHAQAGADLIAPSDMMDGRVGAIRTQLDVSGYTQVPIMAYAAKFASAFYGPFRAAADSAPKKGDRRGHQMDPSNQREALWEMELDFEEGADVLMVKPGLPYLDILALARQTFHCPLAVYQVSGEYSMIKAGAAAGWIDERRTALESLQSMRRAGADWILTYFAPEVQAWLNE